MTKSKRAGRRLREWRKRQQSGKMTLAVLAERLGISVPFLCQIELGKRCPRISLAVELRDLTGIEIEAWGDASRG